MAELRTVVNGKSNAHDGIRHLWSEWMRTEAEWAEDAKRLLRAEMTRRGVTYDDLAAKLAALGVIDTAVNIRNKVARGKFSAVFLLQCLEAIGARNLRIGDADD